MNSHSIIMISSALNEVLNGLQVKDMCAKLECDENDIKAMSEKLTELINAPDSSRCEWSCNELKLQRNIICELLKELDSFEFMTRIGYSEDEAFLVLKEIKHKIDSTWDNGDRDNKITDFVI